jgi:hypothetical protein
MHILAARYDKATKECVRKSLIRPHYTGSSILDIFENIEYDKKALFVSRREVNPVPVSGSLENEDPETGIPFSIKSILGILVDLVTCSA